MKMFRAFDKEPVVNDRRSNDAMLMEDWILLHSIPSLFKWEWALQFHIAELYTPAICLFMPSYSNNTAEYYKAFESLSQKYKGRYHFVFGG